MIAAVGAVPGRGREEIDADGLMVTPGFVDIHTHYDGQATWDRRIAPSCWHGVTTVVMGNCGVGFAPMRPDAHDRLIPLMAGVEDIPGPVLDEGMPWTWESYREYLDRSSGGPRHRSGRAGAPRGAAPLRHGRAGRPPRGGDGGGRCGDARAGDRGPGRWASHVADPQPPHGHGDPTPTLRARPRS